MTNNTISEEEIDRIVACFKRGEDPYPEPAKKPPSMEMPDDDGGSYVVDANGNMRPAGYVDPALSPEKRLELANKGFERRVSSANAPVTEGELQRVGVKSFADLDKLSAERKLSVANAVTALRSASKKS